MKSFANRKILSFQLNSIKATLLLVLSLSSPIYSISQGSIFQKEIIDTSVSSFLGNTVDFKITPDSYLDFAGTTYSFTTSSYTTSITRFDTFGVQQWS